MPQKQDTDLAQEIANLARAMTELQRQSNKRSTIEIGSAILAVIALLTLAFQAGRVSARVEGLDRSVNQIGQQLTDVSRDVSQTRVDVARLTSYLLKK